MTADPFLGFCQLPVPLGLVKNGIVTGRAVPGTGRESRPFFREKEIVMSAYRVLRNAVGIVALGLLAGCATNDVGAVGERPREAITFAAQSSYPSNPKYADQYKSVALYDPTRKAIDIYNLGKDPIPA